MSRVLLLSALILMACGRMPRSSSAADSEKDESGSSEASTSKESSDSSKPEDSEDSEEKSSSSGDGSQSSTNKAPPGPSCLNAQGEVQECMNDKDCCPNFYCGIDPDGSTRIKTCLYGGN